MSAVDPRLLEILVCPLCKGKLVYRKQAAELVCKADRLGYPVKDGQFHVPLPDFVRIYSGICYETASALARR